MNIVRSARSRRALALTTAVAALAALAIASPQVALAGPTVTSQTFGYSGSLQTFTVPGGISALTVTITGGQGGNGGADATPAPDAGGYRGVVTGVIAVTPGQLLTVAVGNGGATGVSNQNATGHPTGAAAGTNPLGGYSGGTGGLAGAGGGSGFGGAGGAASVLQVGGVDIVAGGGGGNGGSGQFGPTKGHAATATYSPRADTTSTAGQDGLNSNEICVQTGCSNNDGGGGGAGGGGAQGGAAGAVEFGAGTSNEWFGYGGSVGRNATSSFSGLTASYQSYAGSNSQAGSIVISYTTGSPAAPTALGGSAGDGAAQLSWTAPVDPGQSAITGYAVRSSTDGGSTWGTPVDLGGTGTTAAIPGLINGTAYLFEVAAVNSIGTGTWSTASAPITPLGPPSAPTVSTVTAADGALVLDLTAPATGAPATGYDYRVDGGAWTSVASPATTLTIPGLVNGTGYRVEVRAESAVGAGAISSPAGGTPQAVPGAPTISGVSADAGTLSVAFTDGFAGGSTITGYEYRLDGGAWTAAAGTTSPILIGGLADGTAYRVELRARNGAGAGSASAPATVATPGLPGAPQVSAVTPTDGGALVAFAPGSTGGAPIDHYEVQTTTGGAWTPVAGTSPILLGGLTDGTAYDIALRAVNAVGAGTASAALPVTPATVPAAPTLVGNTVAGGDGRLTADFRAASDGGAPLTGYEYSTDGGVSWHARTDGGGIATPVVITATSSDGTTPLTGGTVYRVELRAVNAIGAGLASATAPGMPTSAPSAPTVTEVAPMAGAVRVAFTPGANGGSAVTRYEYSLDGGSSWTPTGSLGTSFVVPGLVNGHLVSVQVRATNDIGTGPASAAVTGVAMTTPGPASIDAVVRSDRTLTATVHLADDGGAPVGDWEYSTDGGATWATAPGGASPLVLTAPSSDASARLENGTGYTLQVRALTAMGTGPASAARVVAPASAPAAPSIAVAPGDRRVAIAFSLGTDGGSPVHGIDYSLDGGAHWAPAGTLASPLVVTGLSNGTAYGIALRAANAIGTGAASTTATATPRTVPGAPTGVTASSGDGSATVSWTAPAADGGAAITGYAATAYATSTSTTPLQNCTTTGTSCAIPGLANRTTVFVAVSAINAAGTGAESGPRVLVTPLARPAAPTVTGLTAGDGSLSAAFTAGAVGDGTLTGYQYSLDGGTTWAAASGTTSPIAITGLRNGTAVQVALRAVSTAGPGAASAPRTATPYGYPSAPDPTTTVLNAGDRSIAVSWAAPDLNGGVLGDYTATAFTSSVSGSTAATCTTTGLSCTITGLQNGTTYYVSLQTRNSVDMYSPRSLRMPATPSLVPGAPTAVTATAGDATATVTWTAPTSTGASAITGYTVLCSTGGAFTACGSTTGATSLDLAGLTDGTAYRFEVQASNGSGAGAVSVASAAVTPLAAGVAPTVLGTTSTVDGFRVTLGTPDPGASYAVQSSPGHASLVGDTVVVTGLTPGQTAEATITATAPGHRAAATTVSSAALLTGIAPVLGTPEPTVDGFIVAITNPDASGVYAVTTTAGTATVSSGTVTVTGLDPAVAATVTVTVAHPGYTDAQASAASAALSAGTAPVLAHLTPTADGFTFTITGYDPTLRYSTSLSPSGVAVIGADGHGTVSGEAAGAVVTLALTAVRPGVWGATTIARATVLLPTTAPALSATTPQPGGYTFRILGYDPTLAYSFSQADGGTVVRTGDLVTVSGLAAAATSATTVSVTSAGHTVAVATATGTSFPSGPTPQVGAVTRTADGFAFGFTADPAAVYTATSDAGVVTLSGTTVTVTGLATGQRATVHLTATVAGALPATSDVVGVAIAAGTAPTLGAAVPAVGGFTATITDYSALSGYRVSASSGIVTRDGGRITVAGLADGAAATVTVTAVRAGFLDASATVTGHAEAAVAPAPAAPVPAAPPTTVTHPDPAPASGTGASSAETSDTAASAATAAPTASATPSTSAAPTPAPASAAPATPSGIAESAAGTGAVTANGTVVASRVQTQGSSVVLSGGNGLTMTVTGWQQDHALPLSIDGIIEVPQGGTSQVQVAGLAPGSPVTVWGMSQLTQLSVAHADQNGGFTELQQLPMSMTPGSHTLIVSGVDSTGAPVTLQVGIRVLALTPVAAASPLDWWWLLLLLAAVLATAGYLIARRRRAGREA